MTITSLRRLVVLFALLLFPATSFAQEAILSGTVTDTTGGVLPGVVVTAVHEASGNSFETVTDSAGGYRISVRIGTYRIKLDLTGFATLERTGLQVQVGQQAVINLQMSPATLQESVTVTGEAPLINVTQSNLGSTISAEQVENLPLNGRNWVDLTLLSPGSKQNFVAETPGTSFQLNVDGQQVTQLIATSFGQPRFSRDTIAEFEVITNRFDARQGRSTGMQVNAITKSGTNATAGTISSYFRDDNFNAADPIQHRVLPYSNQQFGATYGGPIVRDRFHYFANFEYEREPYVRTYSSPFPSFNIDQPGTRTEKKGGVRLDYQFSPRTRLTVRTNIQRSYDPLDARWSGGNLHPVIGHRRTEGKREHRQPVHARHRRASRQRIGGQLEPVSLEDAADRELAESPAGGTLRDDQRVADDPVPGLSRRAAARSFAADPDGEGSEHTQRLHAGVQQGWPSRPQSRG